MHRSTTVYMCSVAYRDASMCLQAFSSSKTRPIILDPAVWRQTHDCYCSHLNKDSLPLDQFTTGGQKFHRFGTAITSIHVGNPMCNLDSAGNTLPRSAQLTLITSILEMTWCPCINKGKKGCSPLNMVNLVTRNGLLLVLFRGPGLFTYTVVMQS